MTRQKVVKSNEFQRFAKNCENEVNMFEPYSKYDRKFVDVLTKFLSL